MWLKRANEEFALNVCKKFESRSRAAFSSSGRFGAPESREETCPESCAFGGGQSGWGKNVLCEENDKRQSEK